MLHPVNYRDAIPVDLTTACGRTRRCIQRAQQMTKCFHIILYIAGSLYNRYILFEEVVSFSQDKNVNETVELRSIKCSFS